MSGCYFFFVAFFFVAFFFIDGLTSSSPVVYGRSGSDRDSLLLLLLGRLLLRHG
jgi:hypothetical protein